MTGVPFNIEQIVGALHGSDDVGRCPEALYEPMFARLCASQNVVSVVEAAAVIAARSTAACCWRYSP